MDAFTANSGTLQGRIQPTGWTTPEGSYVLCLGNDVAGDVQTVGQANWVQYEQDASLGSDATVRFRSSTRGPVEIPKVVVVGASAGVKDIIIDGVSHQYTAGGSDSEGTIAAELADAVNAGSSGVEARATKGEQVQLNGLGTSVLAVSGTSLTIATFTWWARMFIDGNLRHEQAILEGYTRDRSDGGSQVRVERDAGGTHIVAFRLELDCDVPGATAELELPAFYVDSIIFEAP
jgi:hypothetical protein